LSCVDCHGGDDTASTIDKAHPEFEPVIAQWYAPEFPLRNKGWNWTGRFDKSFEINGPTELLFTNPGDLRVADIGCGSKNSKAGSTGCHQDLIERVKLNIHAGMQGDLSQVMYLNGDPLQPDTVSRFGAKAVVDPDYDSKTAPVGTVPSLEQIPPVDCLSMNDDRLDINGGHIQTSLCRQEERDCCPSGYVHVISPDAQAMSEGEIVSRLYQNNDCARCHLWGDGSKRTGDMRGSGCTACHMKYANDGFSRSADESIDKTVLSRPETHAFDHEMNDDQCAHCHNRGGRLPQAYHGRRERASGGVTSPFNPPFASYTSLSLMGEGPYSNLHGRVAPFYIDDEDTRNAYDETPADLHAVAGMYCVDCHTSHEVHGDGHIYADRFYEVEIQCQTCHGDKNSVATGVTRKGRKHPRLNVTGETTMLRLMSGRELVVPQIKKIIENPENSRAQSGCGSNTHNEKLECYACHSTWYSICFNCHVERDDSAPERNWTDGLVRTGQLTRDDRKFGSMDTFVLGVNRNDNYEPEGKFAPFIGFGTFNTYKDGIGVVFKDRVPIASDGSSFGVPWNRVHPHTNQRIPRNCSECHRTPNMPDSFEMLEDVECDAQEGDDYKNECKKLDRLRVTYGYGSTRYPLAAFVQDPNNPFRDIAIQYVLDRFVGADRYTINCPDPEKTDDPACLGPNPVSHVGFRALTREEVKRLFSIVAEEHPREDPLFPAKPPLGVYK